MDLLNQTMMKTVYGAKRLVTIAGVDNVCMCSQKQRLNILTFSQ